MERIKYSFSGGNAAGLGGGDWIGLQAGGWLLKALVRPQRLQAYVCFLLLRKFGALGTSVPEWGKVTVIKTSKEASKNKMWRKENDAYVARFHTIISLSSPPEAKYIPLFDHRTQFTHAGKKKK